MGRRRLREKRCIRDELSIKTVGKRKEMVFGVVPDNATNYQLNIQVAST